MKMQKQKLKKGDKVIVITGNDKGKIGEITRIFPSEQKAVVAGVNLKTHHTKPNAMNVGGKQVKEGAIHLSNIAYYDSESKSPTKLGVKFIEDGTKVRFNKHTNNII